MEAVRGVDLKEINWKYYEKVRQGKGEKNAYPQSWAKT